VGRASPWRRTWALPSEHGSWLWWLGPFAVGIAAGGHPGGDAVALFTAALAGFLLHQPAAIAAKALSGRRPREDLRPALVWIGIYAAVGAAALPCLVAHGHARVLGLLVPGALLFAWHLALVARRSERRRSGVAVLGAGVLALAAPAAYWVAGGTRYPEPWVLWSLCGLQSAASIAQVYLRLEQRTWKAAPPGPARWWAGRSTLGWHLAGPAAAGAFALLRHAPWAAALPFALPLADAIDGVARPALGWRPSRVGLRQAVVMAAFTAAMILAWR
jgi:hypothetical protein